MKRVLVVDDERPVVDHIVRMVDREDSNEFLVVGTAASGREALESVSATQPDIIIMDVKMPGLSGLDTVRELKKRGVSASFILSTAYERFDIAREALELGITDYILKPVVREVLFKALRRASEHHDRQTRVDLREFDYLVSDTRTRGFVTEAFLKGISSGWGYSEPVETVAELIWPGKSWALVAVATFLHNPSKGREELESLLQYKTQAHCGPLVSDRCVIYLPLESLSDAGEAEKKLGAILKSGTSDNKPREDLRFGFADPRPVNEVIFAVGEALERVPDKQPRGGAIPWPTLGGSFETDLEFQASMAQNNSDGVRLNLDILLSPYEGAETVDVQDKYRIICLLGSALGRLVGLGALDPVSARHWMDFDDLLGAVRGWEFCLLARSRLPAITGALSSRNRWSVWILGAQNYISNNYGNILTLEVVADQVGLTPKRLSKLFIEELGQGFSDYLIDFRIEKAKFLLTMAGSSIKQVAAECGYQDANYFSRLFKKVTGLTPTEFSTSS